MKPAPELPPPLLRKAHACLAKAVSYALGTQHDAGYWALVGHPRVFDTAIVAHALSRAPAGGGTCARARARALAWLERAEPQSHDKFVWTVETWLREVALYPAAPPRLPALPAPPADRALPHGRRTHLVKALGVSARCADADAQDVLRTAAAMLGADRGACLKPWQRVMLLATEVIAISALGGEAPQATVRALEAEQSSTGALADPMPVVTALAYLALAAAAPERSSTRRALAALLRAQEPDGTWRFSCSFDVWDTAVMVRCLRHDPAFAAHACPSARDFLELAQGADGGWGTISVFPASLAAASDADTTGCVLLALEGTPQGHRVWPAARAYARRRQTTEGLWATWQSADDAPDLDATAHMTAGVRAHDAHAVDTGPARAWLRRAYRSHGQWTSTWYRFSSYGASEMAPAAGRHTPESHDALRRLAEAQRPDGSWDTSPPATGLALAALADAPWYEAPGREQTATRATAFLVESQNGDGTWPAGEPFMYGPRPFPNFQPAQAHAWAAGGLCALLRRCP